MNEVKVSEQEFLSLRKKKRKKFAGNKETVNCDLVATMNRKAKCERRKTIQIKLDYKK